MFVFITILQKSHPGIAFIVISWVEGQAASDVLHELTCIAEILLTHAIRAIQHEDEINRPLDALLTAGSKDTKTAIIV